MDTKKAYEEIFEILDKHQSKIVFNVNRLRIQAEQHLFGIELVERYGFKINPKTIQNKKMQELKQNVFIGVFDGENMRISYPDDGRQPKNETLLRISYPTGAFIFGGDYPTDFFQKFFSELKSYNPEYIDSRNNALYFSLDNAGKIYNDYDSIMERYHEENKKDLKQRQIKKMKEELSKLESQS